MVVLVHKNTGKQKRIKLWGNWGWMQRKREHIAAGEEYTLWSTGVVIKKDLRRQIGNFYVERVSLMKRQSGSEQGRGLDR